MKRNDILWKAALEDLFDDFLRFFTLKLKHYLIYKRDLNISIRNWINYFRQNLITMPFGTSIN